jgi:hypothetical protein
VCDAAVEVLRETGNPAVMWGDEGLLHLIANRAGIRSRGQGPRTSDNVIAALARCPGILVPGKTRMMNGRLVRIFRLPENCH